MEAKDYEELKKKLCKELEDIKSTSKMGMAEIEIIDKLTHSIKNIDKIMEDADYSHGRYNGTSYNDDSYADRRGMHYVRGHYSREGRRMDDGRYSYADGMDSLIDQMEDVINSPSTSEIERNMIRKAMNMLQH